MKRSREDRQKRIHRVLIGTACMLCFGWVFMLPLAVALQSGAKDQFYCTVYYKTLTSDCETRGVSKNWKNVEDRVWSQN